MTRRNQHAKIRPPRTCGWLTVVAPLLTLAFALQLPAAPADRPADTADVAARVKAAFVYNFARFIEWPQAATHESVKIVVVGRGGGLAGPLEEIVRGKTVAGRPLEVTRSVTSASIPRCDILLIERSETRHIKEIAQSLAGKPVLTVCDDADCLKEGAMIAFQLVDESVRFQINQEAAEHAGLKISSQLLKVALPASGPQK
jgi:hypothetical protein